MRFFSTLIASVLGSLIALGLLFFLGLLFIIGLAASSDPQPAVRAGSILVMPLAGPVPEQVSGDALAQAFADEPAVDLHDIRMALKKAAADDRIDAVWLQVRGVAASWGTLQELHDALLDFRASGKPMYASGGESTMSEADYFLASTADSVFADPEAFFEFNGFQMEVMFYAGLLEKLDVAPQIVRVGTYKSAVEPFLRDDLSPASEEQLAAILDDQNTLFMEAIAARRGRTAEAWQQVAAQQALITAEQARDAGLLDALLYEDEVRDQFKARLGIDPDDNLRTVSLEDYVAVPASQAGLETGDAGEIAVVYADGTIMPGESSDGIVGSATFVDAMEEARDDDDVNAIVLRINSPGGSAVASDAMWRAIHLASEQKPVVVSMGDYAASGGYWIATAANGPIVAEPLTLTGSIGVFSVLFDISGFFNNKLGITFDGVQTSPYADMFSGVETLSDAERTLLQQTTDGTYAKFLRKVADSRNLTTAEVDAIAQGRVWTGKQAQQIGLVDELGGLEEALALAADQAGLEEGSYRVRSLPQPKTFFEQLDDALSTQARSVWMRWTTSPVERELLRYARVLEDLATMHGTVQARLPIELRVR